MNIFERIQNEIDKKKEEKRLAEERKRRQEKLEKIGILVFFCACAIGFLAVIISGDSYETGNEAPPVTEKQEDVAEAAPDLIENQNTEPEEPEAAQDNADQAEQQSEPDQDASLACVETGLSANLNIFADNYNKTHTDKVEVQGNKVELPHMTLSSNTGTEMNTIFIYFESTMDQTEENKKLFLDDFIEYLPLLNPCYTTETGTEIVNQALASQDQEGYSSHWGTFETEDLTGEFVEYVSQAPFNINYIFEIRYLPD